MLLDVKCNSGGSGLETWVTGTHRGPDAELPESGDLQQGNPARAQRVRADAPASCAVENVHCLGSNGSSQSSEAVRERKATVPIAHRHQPESRLGHRARLTAATPAPRAIGRATRTC